MEKENLNAPNNRDVHVVDDPTTTRHDQSRESSKDLKPQRVKIKGKRKVISFSIPQEVILHKAESPWKPRRKLDQAETDEATKKTEELFKKVRSILNKLTPQNFQTLVKQVSEMEINTEERLNGVTDLIFESAIDNSEPCYCVAYASMCRYLAMIKVASTSKQGEYVNFRAVLLMRCQKEFEGNKDSKKKTEERKKVIEETQDPEKREELCKELEISQIKDKNRSLGNIRFIGELFNLKMLTENIMHDCLFKLLRAKDEESLECLCRLLSTIGKELDTDRARPRTHQYFKQMDNIVQEKKTSSRVRFKLQDVIDLRKSKWIPRRDENHPKTIDQIHREVQKEEREKQIFLQQLKAQYKTKQERGNGTRGSRGPPGSGMGARGEWNTVGEPNIRVERQSIEPARLKITKQNLDESNIQLGIGGATSRFSGWQKGSTVEGARNFIEQEEPNAPRNRFSALSKPENDSRDRFGTSPARGDSRGRGSGGFGRPQRRDITPRSSKEQEKERALASVRDTIRDRRRERKLDKLNVEKNSKSSSSTVKELTEEEMEKETKIIMNEYLQLQDIKEAILDIKELKSPSVMHTLVSSAVNYVLKRSSIARNQTGLLLHDLVKNNILSIPVYIQGLTKVIQLAEDMENDIPKIWQYFGELIGPMVQGGSVPLNFLRKAAEPLKENNKAGLLVAEVLHAASLTEGHEAVGSLWRQSSLQWEHFMPENDVKKFIVDKKVEFTEPGWQRGSTGEGERHFIEQENSNASSNSEFEDDRRSRFGSCQARGDSHKQGSGGLSCSKSRDITPRSSMEQEMEQALAAVRDVVGGQTPPRQGQSRESSRECKPCRVEIEKSSKPAPPTAKELTDEEMEKKTKIILDEYFHLKDIKEAILCVEELKSPSVMHIFVSSAVNYVLKRSSIARNQTGLLLHDLVKKNVLSVSLYVQGLTEVIQFAEDMEIDIPKIWQHFGELIGPMVQDGSVPLNFLRKAAEPLKENNKAGILVAEVLHAASHREGHKKVGSLWKQSSLQWEDFMPAGDVKKFVIDKKVEFTAGDNSQPSIPSALISMEAIQDKLHQLLIKEKADNEVIFDWIEESVDDPTMKSNKFIRALMTSVCESAITGSGSSARVLPEVVKNRGDLYQKYFDHRAESELQALYAVQALVHKLKHPQGVLRTLFDTLYDEDIISEDGFNQWEKSKDPHEQEGKGVAMKQVVQFFSWLREAEDDVSDS